MRRITVHAKISKHGEVMITEKNTLAAIHAFDLLLVAKPRNKRPFTKHPRPLVGIPKTDAVHTARVKLLARSSITLGYRLRGMTCT